MTDNKVRQPSDRQRALSAMQLRIDGKTYQQIADTLNYRDRSCAYRAVTRLLDRTEAETVHQLRTTAGQRLEQLIAAYLPAATESRDTESARIALRALADHARLYGLNIEHPVTVGISESEFGRRAAELTAVLGVEGSRKVLAEAARLPELPAAVRSAPHPDALIATPIPVGDDADLPGLNGWCNIEADVHPEPATPYGSASGTSTHSGDENPPAVDSAPEIAVVADAEEVLEVEAEIVDEPEPGCGCADPLPPGQRRIRSDEIIDSNGVPYSRSGLGSRIGGYRPLAGYRPGGR